MNKTDRLSPAWHPDELDFLRQHGVVGAGTLPQDLTRVKQRWIYNTLREVFLTANGYVLKRYSHFPGRKDYRKVWKREHDALCRLSDLSTPDSMGYISVNHGTGIPGVLHLRTLVPGLPAVWRTEDDLKNLANLMAGIHQRHVVTLDPQHENFLHTDNHAHPIGFIDFGRARVFRGMSPLMLINMGKDLAKLEIEGGLSSQQFNVFSLIRHGKPSSNSALVTGKTAMPESNNETSANARTLHTKPAIADQYWLMIAARTAYARNALISTDSGVSRLQSFGSPSATRIYQNQ